MDEGERNNLDLESFPQMSGEESPTAVSTWWLDTVRTANRLTNSHRGVLRRTAIGGFRELMRLNVFLPPPRVLLNGPPKSGTHLLSDCLSLLPRMMFSGRHFALMDFARESGDPAYFETARTVDDIEVDEDQLFRFLGACRNGTFVTAHAPFHSTLARAIEEHEFRHVLLVRDPRDVAVSATKYVMRERWHEHHHYYTSVLKSDGERLMATIRGFDGSPPDLPARLSIGKRFSQYLPWLERSSTRVCRFEDLVIDGTKGGVQRATREVSRIAEFVGRPLSAEQAAAISRKMYSSKSPTFRKGSVGDWEAHFDEKHRSAFKEEAGALLVRLGYEQDENW